MNADRGVNARAESAMRKIIFPPGLKLPVNATDGKRLLALASTVWKEALCKGFFALIEGLANAIYKPLNNSRILRELRFLEINGRERRVLFLVESVSEDKKK